MGDETTGLEYPEYILPHSDFGDPECCGLLFPVSRGRAADLTCNVGCIVIGKLVPLNFVRLAHNCMIASCVTPHTRPQRYSPSAHRWRMSPGASGTEIHTLASVSGASAIPCR